MLVLVQFFKILFHDFINKFHNFLHRSGDIKRTVKTFAPICHCADMSQKRAWFKSYFAVSMDRFKYT